MRWLVASVLACVLAVAVSGCTPDLTPPLNSGTANNMAEYFWSAGANLQFDSDRVSVRDSSGVLVATDIDPKNQSHTLLCYVSPDSVFITGFASNSLLDLDDGSYFTSLDTVVQQQHSLAAFAIDKDGDFSVGTDTAVFLGTKSSAFSADKNSPEGVTAFAQVPDEDSLFAATRNGKIWLRHNDQWSLVSLAGLPSGAVVAMTADQYSLYVSIAGATGIYQFSRSSSYWQQMTGFFTQKHVTAMRAGVHMVNAQYLIAGSEDGAVGGYANNGVTTFSTAVSGRVNGFAVGTSEELGIAAAGGVYKLSAPTSSPTSLNPGPVTSIAFISNGFLLISQGAVNLVSSPVSGPTTGFVGNPLALLSESGTAYLLTDSAIYSFSDVWHSLPGFPLRYYPAKVGGLLALKSNPLVDSSWRAGTLVDRSHRSYAITARTLGRLDTLTVGTQTFRDVIVMRYAHELAGAAVDSVNIPYWVIYYERGRGPIMFERVKAGETPQPRRRKIVGQ